MFYFIFTCWFILKHSIGSTLESTTSDFVEVKIKVKIYVSISE